MFVSIKTVLQELWENKYRLYRLAVYEVKAQNSETMLGVLWNFLNPILQILVYWFVFAIGLNAAVPRGGYPYIMWMIVGVIPWFYIGNSLMSATGAIRNFAGVLKRMYLPLSIVPVKSILAAFLSHLGAMVIVFVIFFAGGYRLHAGALWLLYFMFCSVVFLVGYALLTSAITVVFKDFQRLMSSVIRLLFYISPIVWAPENLPGKVQFVLKLNPIAYIISGYRDSILYGSSLAMHWKQGIYFWCVTLLLFAVGCSVHMKFRKEFMDLI